LQNKRGVLKLPFKLPDYIEKTGISKLRDINVNGAAMVLFVFIKIHQKLRERMKPRMGKMDIDYDVLHDAFFKY
jgi:splicing factor 3B subunit 2